MLCINKSYMHYYYYYYFLIEKLIFMKTTILQKYID